MTYCMKCGSALTGETAAYCAKCGAPNQAARSAPRATPKVEAPFGQPSIGVQALRSRGESVALLAGFGLFAVSWLVLDIATAFVPLLLGTAGLIVYVLYQQGALKGSSVAVSPRNFPDIEALAEEAAARIGIGKPNLFIKQSRELNAYAMGFVGSACVVVHSEIVSATEHAPRDLQFIVGHEFTHIKCSHVLWQTIAAKNPLLGSIPVLNAILPLFFSWWSRQAELTADRGGLIACGDLAASQRALARLAIGAELFDRLNVDEFVKQAYDGDVATKANELFSSHPLLAKRIVALAEFAQSPLATRVQGLKARAQEVGRVPGPAP